MRFLLIINMLLLSLGCRAQQIGIVPDDSVSTQLFERGSEEVNQCTPWHHLKCVYITGTEVYKDGRAGKSTRHWWRMSYIGRACTAQYGNTFGRIFEGLFVIPHYIGVGFGNGMGYAVYLVRGSPEKVEARKRARRERRLLRAGKKSEKLDS